MKDFRQFKRNSCFSYLIVSNAGRALLVDPHLELIETYRRHCTANGITLVTIVETHTHADHLSGAAALKKELNIPVLGHEKSVSRVLTERIAEGTVIPIDEITVTVRYAPGHTDDCVNLLCENRLLTADTLLIGSIGRTDFQNGDPGLAYDTLKRIAGLPEETEIYPGHDYKGNTRSILKTEKKDNPYLKYSDRSKFIADMKSLNIPKPANMDHIVKANQEGTARAVTSIPASELAGKMSGSQALTILDVRNAAELLEMKVENAVHIPLPELPGRIGELFNRKSEEIATLCRSGNRATMAAHALQQAGFTRVSVIEGGIMALAKAGYPVITSHAKWSIDRQVRLAAGSLVFAFSLLALAVNPWFILGSLFVGGGLVFSGLTNTCGMAALLMKLPYNRLDMSAGGGSCAVDGAGTCAVPNPEAGGGTCAVDIHPTAKK